MTDFNALPLAEQLKHLQPGDELHLRGGGWLPFVEYDYPSKYIVSHHYAWLNGGVINQNGQHGTDIIRVVRPAPKEQAARKVPEVVERLREIGSKKELQDKWALHEIANVLADHFEKETP